MTASELITEVRELLDAPSGQDAYYTDARILAWINQEYVSFCRNTSWNLKQTNSDVNGDSTYENIVASIANSPLHHLPSDFLTLDVKGGVGWLDTSGKRRKLKKMDRVQAEMEGWFQSINCSGIPSHYDIRYHDSDTQVTATKSGKVLEVFPYPSAIGNRLQAWYIAQPTLITTTPTVTSPNMPHDWQWGLVYGATSIGKAKRRIMDEAAYWRSRRDELWADAYDDVSDRAKDEYSRVTDVYTQYRE